MEVQRAKGKPKWQFYEFKVQEERDYFVNITNGDLFNQDTACSSAEINLQGYGNLFGPSDFNKNVFEIKKRIHLTLGNYTLNAILRSQVVNLTIVISNKDIFSYEEFP